MNKLKNYSYSSEILITNFFSNLDFKVFIYYLKIKKYFKTKEKEVEYANEINKLENFIRSIESKYPQEIRKQKLIKLK